MSGPDTKLYGLNSDASPTAGSGTVDIAVNFVSVTGHSTHFLTDYRAGDTLVINGEEHVIEAIYTNTTLDCLGEWQQTLSGHAYSAYHLTLLSALSPAVAWPRGANFQPYSTPLDLGDGSVRGAGWASTHWDWDFLTRDQREALRAYWPAHPTISTSIAARVCTPINDFSDTFRTFTAQVLWPQQEPKAATRRVPFSLVIRKLVAIDDPN